MNILFYSPQTLPSVGGLQYVVHYWAEALGKKGNQVTLISETKGAKEQLCSYTIYENIPLRQQRTLLATAQVFLYFDVSLKGLPLWIGSGKPLIFSHQSGLWYEGKKIPFRQQLKRWVANHLATKNIACSRFIAKSYKRCEVVYNPIRQDLFAAPEGIKRLPGTILFAGRLVTDKGVDLLMEAFSILQKSLPKRTLKLWIAGDGPEKEALIRRSVTLGISDQVFFLGMLSQEDLVGWMHQCSVMVVPSRMEPMGMVAAEGLAAGCTMVLSNNGGLPEVGGPFCHYFQSEDVVSLADALQQAVEKPLVVDATALQQHLSQFTIEHSIRELEEMLKR